MFIIQHAKLLCPWGKTSRIFIYEGMRDRSMRRGTKLAWEIQLTDWSTAGNLSNRSSGVQIPRDICTRFGRYLYSTWCSWIIKGWIFSFSYTVAFSCSLPIHRRCLAQVQENLAAEVVLRCVWLSRILLRYVFFVLLSIVVFYSFKLSSSLLSERNALKRKNHLVSKEKMQLFKTIICVLCWPW